MEKAMPWEQVTVQQSRKEFVLMARQADANISQLCERFGISRKTGYKWLGRAAQDSLDALDDRSRRPHGSPSKSLNSLEQAVVQLRQRHAAWGGRKISHVLARDHQLHLAPSTVTNILHRHHLITPTASEAATPWQRFEHEEPNAMWQMDFKGHFGVATQRCHPLTVIDDHSRYSLALQACRNEQRQTVQAVLQRVFARYGLPRRINTDNGPPWGSAGQGPLTALGVWLIRLGVHLSHSRAMHPQTNGKDERFHRTLKAEVLHQYHFADFDSVQPEFDRWRYVYNCERPHQALDMQTPAQRYRASPISMPRNLPAIEYGPGDLVRQVQQGGWVHLKGKELRLSKALTGQPVALRAHSNVDGRYDVYFCHQFIDSISLNQIDDH
jgi:transposase InsO family protein